MRKLILPTILALCLIAPTAHADRGYDHGGYGHLGGGSGWAGLAIFGALTGLAIMAERTRPVYVDPYYVGPVYPQRPIYVEQQPAFNPPAPANPAGAWYYCGSSAMYYPYTQACPEGWQTVPARP
jgi:hypothetical protein